MEKMQEDTYRPFIKKMPEECVKKVMKELEPVKNRKTSQV